METAKLALLILLAIAQVAFLTMKLTGVVSWPWWLVLAPLYPIAAWFVWAVAVSLLALWWLSGL